MYRGNYADAAGPNLCLRLKFRAFVQDVRGAARSSKGGDQESEATDFLRLRQISETRCELIEGERTRAQPDIDPCSLQLPLLRLGDKAADETIRLCCQNGIAHRFGLTGRISEKRCSRGIGVEQQDAVAVPEERREHGP